jgi:hypothetical protein
MRRPLPILAIAITTVILLAGPRSAAAESLGALDVPADTPAPSTAVDDPATGVSPTTAPSSDTLGTTSDASDALALLDDAAVSTGGSEDVEAVAGDADAAELPDATSSAQTDAPDTLLDLAGEDDTNSLADELVQISSSEGDVEQLDLDAVEPVAPTAEDPTGEVDPLIGDVPVEESIDAPASDGDGASLLGDIDDVAGVTDNIADGAGLDDAVDPVVDVVEPVADALEALPESVDADVGSATDVLDSAAGDATDLVTNAADEVPTAASDATDNIQQLQETIDLPADPLAVVQEAGNAAEQIVEPLAIEPGPIDATIQPSNELDAVVPLPTVQPAPAEPPAAQPIAAPSEPVEHVPGGDIPLAEPPPDVVPVPTAPDAPAPVEGANGGDVPISETPAAEIPVVAAPVDDAPESDRPVAGLPVVELPVAEAPTGDPPARQPVREPHLEVGGHLTGDEDSHNTTQTGSPVVAPTGAAAPEVDAAPAPGDQRSTVSTAPRPGSHDSARPAAATLFAPDLTDPLLALLALFGQTRALPGSAPSAPAAPSPSTAFGLPGGSVVPAGEQLPSTVALVVSLASIILVVWRQRYRCMLQFPTSIYQTIPVPPG